MNRNFDILIVGAGIVGLAAANLLGRNPGMRVTLTDAGSRPVFDASGELSLRVSAISPGSVNLLKQIGIWSAIEAQRACPFLDMKVWDASGSVDGPETVCFDAAEFAVPQLGFIVENVLIRHALMESLDETDVSVCFETPIETVRRSDDRMLVKLNNEEILTPDLLLGADGANSLVRQSADIQVTKWSYAQKALVTHLRPEIDHQHTAWQRFLQDGPIGLLPLADGRISIVWSTTSAQADEALSLSDQALMERLAEVTDGVLGALTPTGARGAFPLNAQHANRYVDRGLALIGDAAHAIHPLAGQGVNLGLADAELLASVVDSAIESGENPGDLPVLRKYERARKGANLAMLQFTDGINRLFSNPSAAVARLRGAGMFLFNRSGPIRNRAVATALGIR